MLEHWRILVICGAVGVGPGTSPLSYWGLLYFDTLDTWLQMSGYLSCLNCACELATAKWEEREENVVVFFKKEGKTNGKHMKRRRQHLKKTAVLFFHVLRIKTLVSSPTSLFHTWNLIWHQILRLYFANRSRIQLLLTFFLLPGSNHRRLLLGWAITLAS